jgi:hypothetical protein
MGPGVDTGGATIIVFRGRRAGGDSVAANDNHAQEPVKTVTIRRKLEKSGVEVKIKVPVGEFIGVAVSSSVSEEGVLTSAIELVHPDRDLNYRVFEEEGNVNIVAEWQNWGRKLRLPLYIRAGDGTLLPYSQQVDGVLLGNLNARRRLAAEALRRPRFLNRRQPGEGEQAV